MSFNQNDPNNNIPMLIGKLCSHFTKSKTELSSNLLKYALNFLMSATNMNSFPTDEQCIIRQIRKFLKQNHSADTVEKFDLLYIALQKSSILKKQCSILTFLFHTGMGQSISDNENKCYFLERIESDKTLDHLEINEVSSSTTNCLTDIVDTSQEGVENIYSANLPKSNLSSITASSHVPFTKILAFEQMCSRTLIGPIGVWSQSDIDLSLASSTIPNVVSEEELIQDVIYCFQGIEGKYLHKEPDGLGFYIDCKGKCITMVQKGKLERLACIGFLHNQLKQHCEKPSENSGSISQALTTVLREELSEYYRIVAMFQAQLKKQSNVDNTDLTLRRILVWASENHMRFQWLAYIADECSGKIGGQLISSVHGFMQHGSHCVQTVSAKVLTAVCRPFYLILSRWLLNGEIIDPCNEFFIKSKKVNSTERLWHDQYYVEVEMVPAFITMEQATTILAMGKTITYLKQVCKENSKVLGGESLQRLISDTTPDNLFDLEAALEFHAKLNVIYKKISARVMDLLIQKYRLLEHLYALRKYLLLGQGDFIRYLLELLEPELSKPVENLYGHTLNSILDAAIRGTNAQFEEEDTLRRIHVSLVHRNHGEIGWDVFSLIYLVDGPISTIFQPTIKTYKSLFGTLWKAKRMELVLSNIRKQQISFSKLFRHMKVLTPVLHLIHILTSQMIHFLHQTQYYFLFEVLECSWAEMLQKVQQAESLDETIKAHNIFLNSVKCGMLLDSKSTELCLQLRVIFKFILDLEVIQNVLYTSCLNEFEDISVTSRVKINLHPRSNSRKSLSKIYEIKEESAQSNTSGNITPTDNDITDQCFTENYDSAAYDVSSSNITPIESTNALIDDKSLKEKTPFSTPTSSPSVSTSQLDNTEMPKSKGHKNSSIPLHLTTSEGLSDILDVPNQENTEQIDRGKTTRVQRRGSKKDLGSRTSIFGKIMKTFTSKIPRKHEDNLKQQEIIKNLNILKTVDKVKEDVINLGTAYREFLQSYLVALGTNPNMKLQLLSVRLNFNDYYTVT